MQESWISKGGTLSWNLEVKKKKKKGIAISSATVAMEHNYFNEDGEE